MQLAHPSVTRICRMEELSPGDVFYIDSLEQGVGWPSDYRDDFRIGVGEENLYLVTERHGPRKNAQGSWEYDFHEGARFTFSVTPVTNALEPVNEREADRIRESISIRHNRCSVIARVVVVGKMQSHRVWTGI